VPNYLKYFKFDLNYLNDLKWLDLNISSKIIIYDKNLDYLGSHVGIKLTLNESFNLKTVIPSKIKNIMVKM
jgi:hypothetical protein